MPKVQEIVVTLRFHGDNLDPQTITHKLGATSSSTVLKGATLPSASGLERVAKTSQWQLRVEADAPDEFDGQVSRLFSQLPAEEDAWRDLSGRFSGNLFVGLFLDNSNEGLVIGAETLRAIAARGLDLHLDIYGPPDD